MRILMAVGLLIFSLALQADESAQPIVTNQYDYSAWNIGVGYYSLDAKQAFSEGIDDKATFLKFGWTGQTSDIAYGLGMTGLILEDEDSFEVLVDDPYSGTQVRSSNANALGGYAELGYSLNMGLTGKLDLMTGFEIISASRGISNCTDCPEEDINLDSGLYVEPRLRFIQPNGFIFSLSWRQYLSGDIEGGILLDFAWNTF